MSTILHVIPRLTLGGASRSLITAVRALSERPSPNAHTIVSLRPGEAEMTELAAASGIEVVHAPEPDRLDEAMVAADIVQIEWWNTPEMSELLRRRLPPARLALWSHVGGGSAPQVLAPELIALPDAFVASTPITGEPVVIPDIADPARLEGMSPGGHRDYAVGYLGTVDPSKMHAQFTDMSAAVDVPGCRFVVAGTGDGFAAIAARAEELGARDRFDLRGYVRDVRPVLAGIDVFGYPLCRGNYGAAELVLQEAMHAGVPPVVLPHGGAATLVDDGETGIVAADEREYVQALERLGRDPDLRGRLGTAAREHARREWSPAAIAGRWADVHDELLQSPKRSRPPLPPAARGAELFVAGLGAEGGPFRDSLDGASHEADAPIAQAAPVVVSSDGGLLDYRRRYPDDPELRLWSGLVLRAQGRNALAAGELAAAIRLGCDPRRAAPALAAAGDALGHPEVAGRARAAAQGAAA